MKSIDRERVIIIIKRTVFNEDADLIAGIGSGVITDESGAGDGVDNGEDLVVLVLRRDQFG